MRNAIVSLPLSLLCTCVAPSDPPAPGQLVSTVIMPTPLATDRVARLPTITLAFDQPLSQPAADSVWLLLGDPTSTLASEASHGTLATTEATRRIAANIAWNASDPATLALTPDEPLAPDTIFTLVASSLLTTASGVFTQSGGTNPAPIIQTYRVAPARQCPSLATLTFPESTEVPLSLDHVTVAFDRPLFALDDTPVADVQDVVGNSVAANPQLACGDGTGGYWCANVSIAQTLQANSNYTVVIGSVGTADGTQPQSVQLNFTTGTDPAAVSTPILLITACAADEMVFAPFCLRVDTVDLVLRGTTSQPGSIRATTLSLGADSPVGTQHQLILDGVPTATQLGISTEVLAPDGSVSDPRTFGPVATADQSPTMRITEVLAKTLSTTAQQFVEILNDGSAPVSTDGLRIVTIRGSSNLPSAVIAPGQRAVIVSSTFNPQGVPERGDPPVAPEAVLLQLTGKIAGHGLATTGEDVWIADSAGHRISFAPTASPSIAPKPGISIVRGDPRMREDDLASWAYDAGGGSTPGGPDTLR